MSRNSGAKPAQVLYIGREDPGYEKVWQGLEQEGVEITFAHTQTLGLQLARELKPSIVVVNPTNSHFSGERLCHTLRHKVPQARRLLLIDRGQGKQIEADERLVRPFTPKKLRDTITKTLDSLTPHTLHIGPLQLDLSTRTVQSPRGTTHLTPKQCHLLAIFMQRPNQVISREDLMREIWDTHYLGDTRTLDVHIRWLREKIEAKPTRPTLLVTVRRIGYKMVADVPALPPIEDEPLALVESEAG